jgi:hypothetical protein
MSVYPFELDDDITLPRVDDNITETGQEAINALRDAVFNVQETLGIEPQGSVTTVANRLDASLNPDGTIKSSALTSIGLVTLPITNNQVGTNAGIEESKLSLVHSTTDLYTLISANSALLNSLNTFVNNTVYADLNLHISGATYLSDGVSSARHVLSHIDLNSVPSDIRDPFFTWTGLKDKNNNLRSAVTAADGLLAVNNALVDHENLTSAHQANAIDVNTDNFIEIPLTATTVQSALDYLDRAEVLNMGQHRATQHANAIPRISRSESLIADGYGDNVVPSTTCHTYLSYPLGSFPVDDLFFGDDVVRFFPDNSNFKFDAYFSQIKQGDIIRVNYGNGLESVHVIDSIRFIPGAEWIIRINGVNLCSSVDGYASARVDRALYDVNTAGIFATASANARTSTGPTATSTLPSVVVSDPRGAMALGLNFDPGQLNSTHYNLYLQLYPTGNPVDKVVILPAIDVTGNSGTTPGAYTISSVVSTTNDKLRQFGYNYRFIAFEYNGEFGLMLADVIDNASFSIISGTNVGGTLSGLPYTNNVIGGGTSIPDSFDALGLGIAGANLASPAYLSGWTSSVAALAPTKIIRPLKKRYAIVNGLKVDKFAPTYLATNGYWDGYVSARNQLGTTVETTYTVLSNLSPSGIKPGKTIVVQPAIAYDNALYNDVDYGRFIIKSVNFIGECGTAPSLTQITVLNSIHAYGSPVIDSAEPSLAVKLYFSYDSVGFDNQNLIDPAVYSTDYKRFHEIYLTEQGKTFAHERARMPIQPGLGNLVSTSNLHILDVSPKLRGYTDGVLGQFNKYIRLYVLNYNATSGEFDGYLGQRDTLSANVLKTGKIVTGKKNVATRFYDETNIDYIDLIFSDPSNPGTSIAPTPGYVDIEIFNGLKTDDELFLVATCEVNWDPVPGENIIQYITDQRQFGSVDETDFADSAKEYISAADRYLHDNGVVRGLDYEAFASNGELKFKGGLAVVNGKIITANNQSVTVPQIRPFGSPLGTSVNWAICLKEDGSLVPYPLTTNKQIYYATANGLSSYQIVSLTFNEIVNQRKDLCLIAIATVTIASITVTGVSDARKFVAGLDSAAPLVWSSDENYLGNFYSFEAVKNYLNNSKGKSNKISLRGSFNITSSLDLTGFTRPVTIDGSEADITFAPVGLGTGILLGSNLHLENWRVTYSPSGITYTTNYTRNEGSGCFYFQGGSASNIKINNCTFISSTLQHPPFINFEYEFGDILENIIIENNYFSVPGATSLLSLSNFQAAIVFCNTGGSSSDAAWLKHVIIKDNYSEDYHGIYVTANTSGTAPPGTHVNCIIENNTCGTIGYWVGTDGTSSYGTNQALIIKNNFAKLICTFIDSYVVTSNTSLTSFGNVLIEGNSANWISCQTCETDTLKSSLTIKNNKLTAWDTYYLNYFVLSGSILNSAIIAFNTSSSNYMTPMIVEGNAVTSGVDNSLLYDYNSSVRVSGSANIINNIISGIGISGIGLVLTRINTFGNNHIYNVINNQFLRQNKNIIFYISVAITGAYSLATNATGRIQNNIFDSNTVDGSSDIVTNFSYGLNPSNWVYDSNKNNTTEITLNNQLFHSSINAGFFSIVKNFNSTSIDSNITESASSIGCFYLDTGSNIDFSIYFNLLNAIPPNSKINSVVFNYTISANPSSVGSVSTSLLDSYGTNASFSSINLLSATPVVPQSATRTLNAASGFISHGTSVPVLRFSATITSSSTLVLSISSIVINYTSL